VTISLDHYSKPLLINGSSLAQHRTKSKGSNSTERSICETEFIASHHLF
jgi:hypothetical protein